MKKSDKLDQLRLEVGMIADVVQSVEEFYSGVIHTIGSRIPIDFGVAIYRCEEYYFSLFSGSGDLSESEEVKFGDGLFSISAIRGKLVSSEEDGRFKVFSPFYEQHHLIGMIVVEIPLASYQVSEEDLIFIRELTRFIEIRRKKYLKNVS